MKKITKRQKNVIKNTIYSVTLLLIGVIIGLFVSYKLIEPEATSQQETLTKKESPYTYEELEEIIMNPERFRELNGPSRDNEFGEIICHFYDYYSKDTLFPYAKVVERDEQGFVIKVTEIGYKDYYTYIKNLNEMKFYEYESSEKKMCEENNENSCLYDYKHWAQLITNVRW